MKKENLLSLLKIIKNEVENDSQLSDLASKIDEISNSLHERNVDTLNDSSPAEVELDGNSASTSMSLDEGVRQEVERFKKTEEANKVLQKAMNEALSKATQSGQTPLSQYPPETVPQ